MAKTYAKAKKSARGPMATSLSSLSRSTQQTPTPLGQSTKKSYKKKGTENGFEQFGDISFGNTAMTGED